MRIVVIGASGLIGSKLMTRLTEQGHEAIAASRRTGVDAYTGEGLARALDGASVVVDVSSSPSSEDALEFTTMSTRNILDAERAAGVGHHVALSVVGADRLSVSRSGYFSGKLAQERLIEASSIPYSIIRATQFFEFVETIVRAATEGDAIRVAPALIEPIAADDAARAVGRTAVGPPSNRVVEVAGPEQFRLDVVIDLWLQAHGHLHEVVADQTVRYFGALIDERTLLPDDFHASRATTRYRDWLRRYSPAGRPRSRPAAESPVLRT
jgi:uncharacterized protein YbjT (DUF2867 family)